MEHANLALITKLGWRFLSYPSSRWSSVLKGKYHVQDQFWNLYASSSSSWIWRGILASRFTLKQVSAPRSIVVCLLGYGLILGFLIYLVICLPLIHLYWSSMNLIQSDPYLTPLQLARTYLSWLLCLTYLLFRPFWISKITPSSTFWPTPLDSTKKKKGFILWNLAIISS